MEKNDLSARPGYGFEVSLNLWKVGRNCLKIAGYIPLVGAISGVTRVAIAVFSDNHKASSSPTRSLAGHIFRGIAEIVGVGLVFLPVDVVITIYRGVFKDSAIGHRKDDKPPAQPPNARPLEPPKVSPPPDRISSAKTRKGTAKKIVDSRKSSDDPKAPPVQSAADVKIDNPFPAEVIAVRDKIHEFPRELDLKNCGLTKAERTERGLSIQNDFGVKISIRCEDLLESEAHFIINAANAHLKGGDGIDGAIHKAGGQKYKTAHRALKKHYHSGYTRGFSSLIPSGDLSQKKKMRKEWKGNTTYTNITGNIKGVMVVAGPRSLEREIEELKRKIKKTANNDKLNEELQIKEGYKGIEPEEVVKQKENELFSLVYNSLSLADKEGRAFLEDEGFIMRTSNDKKINIAMPLISTGAYKYPFEKAVRIHYIAIHEFLKNNPASNLGEISIHFFESQDKTLKSFEDTLPEKTV